MNQYRPLIYIFTAQLYVGAKFCFKVLLHRDECHHNTLYLYRR
jgi:hypothetical protein